MAAPLINLDFNQINTLQDFQSAGQYADAYRYMRDIVRDQQPYASTLERAMEYQRLENWLDRAASINANDGSYSSEFVRGATEAIAEKIGKPINDARFQDASDKLAKSVIKDVIDNQGILSPTDIINRTYAKRILTEGFLSC